MSERFTNKDCERQFERAVNAARANGIDTKSWSFNAGSSTNGVAYTLMGAGIGSFSHIGRTAREAHATLAALAFAWEKSNEARSQALAGRHVQIHVGPDDNLTDVAMGTIDGVPIPVTFIRPASQPDDGSYRVVWEIDIEGATSARDAAQQARAMQTAPDTTAVVFDVHGREGVEQVDLMSDDQIRPDAAPACDCGRAPDGMHKPGCALLAWERARLTG
jgi:hypothetical protein